MFSTLSRQFISMKGVTPTHKKYWTRRWRPLRRIINRFAISWPKREKSFLESRDRERSHHGTGMGVVFTDWTCGWLHHGTSDERQWIWAGRGSGHWGPGIVARR